MSGRTFIAVIALSYAYTTIFQSSICSDQYQRLNTANYICESCSNSYPSLNFQNCNNISSSATLSSAKPACSSTLAYLWELNFNYYCWQCPTGFIPSSNGCTYCQKTLNGSTCSCATSTLEVGNYCLTSTEQNSYLDGTQSISYTPIMSCNNDRGATVTVTSKYFATDYGESVYGCTVKNDPILCQKLANFCVLSMYSSTNAACVKYLSSYQNTQLRYVPKLYMQFSDIQQIFTLTVLLNSNSKDTQSINSLSLILAKFHLNGTYAGKEDFTSQLSLCPLLTISESKRFREVGTNTFVNCLVNLTSLNSTNVPYLYEAFLNKDNDYIPIPVKILNIKENSDTDTSNDVFVKRFFVTDFITGIPSGTGDSIYRWPTQITFNVTLNDKEQINLPMIIIKYDEVYSKATDCSPIITQSSFESSYSMDISYFKYIAMIFLIVLNLVVAGIFALRLYLWKRSNSHPKLLKSSKIFVMRTIYLLLDTWSTIFFWFIFAIAAYWFIFYKLENRIYLLLPIHSWEIAFAHMDIIFGLVLFTKLLSMILRIMHHSSADVFFLDYDLNNEQGVPDSNEVSSWRSIFLANEFVENAQYRHISIELTIFIFLFFYDGLGWEFVANESPFIDNTPTTSPENIYLKYFIISALLITIGMIQWVLKLIMSIWIPISLQNYVDLCSIANTSILVLDSLIHGYYIRGESPYGKADVSAKTLYSYLEKSIRSGKDDISTYEFYIDYTLREKISTLYEKEALLWQSKDKDKKYEALEESKLELSSLLFKSIKSVEPSKKKTVFERFIGLLPPSGDGNMFYKGIAVTRWAYRYAEADDAGYGY